MSRRNLDVLRRGEVAFNSGGPAEIGDVVTDDVEWGTTGSFPGIGHVYRGPAGMAKWREDVKSVWESFEVRLVEVLDEQGERLVVEERVRGRGLESGVEVEMSIFSTYYFRDGKIARRVAYKDRGEALEAAGLQE